MLRDGQKRQEGELNMALETFDRLVRIKEVVEILAINRSTFWRLRESGDFPEPLTISARNVAWRKSTVDAWIDSR